MTDKESHKREALTQMINSDVWRYYVEEMKERQAAGWEKFIALPPERKIAKVAYKHQADYNTLRDALSWPDEQIRILEARK